MEKRETELLERLKTTQQQVMETEAKLDSKIHNRVIPQSKSVARTKTKNFYKLGPNAMDAVDEEPPQDQRGDERKSEINDRNDQR